jgi:hypothetical protein
MEDRLDDYYSVPHFDYFESCINSNVPVHNDGMNQSYLYRDRCANPYFPVNQWFRLRDKSKCNCHEDHQLVPVVISNDDYSLPDVIFNHIIDYWRSVPASNHLFFPDDVIDPFDDFIPLPSPYRSFEDDNTNNTDHFDHDPVYVEENTEDDTNIYINVDSKLSYTPDHSSQAYSFDQNDVSDGTYDHPFIID